MHASQRPSSKQYLDNLSPVSSPWLKLGRISVLAATLLSACGGGGGGGSASTSGNDMGNTGTSGTAYSGNFPVGMALASPAALADSTDLISGGLAIVAPGVSTAKTLQQGVWASQADAVATGRLDISTSGLLSASTLFDTAAGSNASCYSPSVIYLNHDDSSTSGTLPTGDVAMWVPTDTASPPLACGAAELNALTGNQTAQIQQAVLLTAALRRLMATDPAHQVPSSGASLDITSRASTLLTPLLSGVTVNSASAGLSSDGSEYSYRLVLTQGSGASAQSIEVNLLHTPTDTDVRYYGVLQITSAYLTADATLGCTDQMSSGLYKTARLTTLDYNRQYDLLSVRTRAGQYCGNPNVSSTTHMADLATVSLYGELDPTVFLTSATRGSTLGWRRNFSSWTADIGLSDLSSDFLYVWQGQPDGSAGSHARIFAGTHTLNAGTGARSLALYHGYTDDISTTDGTLQGMLCNDHGPGSSNTVQPLFQYQTVDLGSGATAWASGITHIRYAPTNSCSASSMTFDADDNGTVSSGEGLGSHDLMGLTSTHADVQEEITTMGFLTPSLLP